MTSRKTAPPDVLFVNGASSAGKTSLIRAVQNLVPVPYLHVGLDHFFASVPEPWGGGGPGRYSGEGFSYQACESFADALPGPRSQSGGPERQSMPPIGGRW